MFLTRLAVVFASCFLIRGTVIEIENNADSVIWVANTGSFSNKPLQNGGFILNPAEKVSLEAPDDWIGTFWARTYCDNTTNRCLTGDCGNGIECKGKSGTPPQTLIEVSFRLDGSIDYYDISLIDGFNINASITATQISRSGNKYKELCDPIICSSDINGNCPEDLQVKNKDGTVIGCNNCDTQECKAAELFHTFCPNVYTSPFDDFTLYDYMCKDAKYSIVFG